MYLIYLIYQHRTLLEASGFSGIEQGTRTWKKKQWKRRKKAAAYHDGEGNHEIEEIVGIDEGGVFLLQWKGHAMCTPQPPEDLAGCLDSVMDFLNEVIHPLKLRVIRSSARRKGSPQRTAPGTNPPPQRAGSRPMSTNAPEAFGLDQVKAWHGLARPITSAEAREAQAGGRSHLKRSSGC
jgi:hypothetical protein